MSNDHAEGVATAKFKEDTNGDAKAYPQRRSSASLRDSDAYGPLALDMPYQSPFEVKISEDQDQQ